MKFGVGQAVPRKEDPRMITGGGRFTADVELPNQLHLAMFRSPYPFGEISRLDVTAARRAPGVHRVFTAADIKALGGMPCRAQLTDAQGEPGFIPHRPVLADKRVCFVGQAVVAVIADTPELARNAAELVELEIDDLPHNVRLDAAENAAVIHPERGSNLCVHWQNGDAAATTNAIDTAAHVVTLDVINNRVAPSPLEPRACVGVYEDDVFTLYNPSQGPVAQQGVLARAIFKVDPDQVRVICLDTGGGFGIRGEVHPEPILCLFAARELDRPVKWVGDRSEMFLTDSHGRDNLTTGTLALDGNGRITGFRIETLANLGAYCTAVGPFVPTMGGGRIAGTVYDVPNLHQSVKCLFTNTMPVAAYRGAGRPEACYLTERLIEAAAKQLGVSALELRRKNFIRPEQLPYTNHMGVPVKSGMFEATMDLALQAADVDGFAERQERSRAQGKLRGWGLGYYVESSGGGVEEEAQITLQDDGTVDVIVGTYSHGQGHRTTYSQIIADALGIEFDAVNVIQGDTREVKFGGGTGGSRSSQMGGVAVLKASEAVANSGRRVAAQLLQSEVERVRFEAGLYRDEASGAEATLADVARAAVDPQFGGAPLAETLRYNREGGYTFPNGCHVAEIEIDPATGVLDVVSYTCVDDCGRVINPLLAAGQVHGGVGQGAGQAMYEQVVYDIDSGQLVTGTLMDYVMPRASHLSDVEVSFNEVLQPDNDLGVKGIGEGGACGAPPAIVHATLQALEPLGVTDIDMPLTAEKIWRLTRRDRTERDTAS